MNIDRNIDKTAEKVRGYKTERETTRTAKAIKEIHALGKKVNEEDFDAICAKHKVNPLKAEAIIFGETSVTKQRENMRRHALTHRTITNSAAFKKYGCVRFDARMAEISRDFGIVFNRREVKASNGVEYVRYELKSR
jgi:hypothetical protein